VVLHGFGWFVFSGIKKERLHDLTARKVKEINETDGIVISKNGGNKTGSVTSQQSFFVKEIQSFDYCDLCQKSKTRFVPFAFYGNMPNFIFSGTKNLC